MASRSKGKTRTGSGLSDAARPDDRVGDDLDELEEVDEPDDEVNPDERRATPSSDSPDQLLAEGEPVGTWSEDEQEDNTFDAADRSADADEDDSEAPAGYQAAGTEGDDPRPGRPGPRTPPRRRSH
jgi:hypothetical protein